MALGCHGCWLLGDSLDCRALAVSWSSFANPSSNHCGSSTCGLLSPVRPLSYVIPYCRMPLSCLLAEDILDNSTAEMKPIRPPKKPPQVGLPFENQRVVRALTQKPYLSLLCHFRGNDTVVSGRNNCAIWLWRPYPSIIPMGIVHGIINSPQR